MLPYIVFQYNVTKNTGEGAAHLLEMERDATERAPVNHKKAVMMVMAGLLGLALGAELLIRGSVTTARILNVPDSIIGLTVIALGTSLPELTTCAVAAMKRQVDVIIGNLVGSNVFNLMMILGSMGIIKAYDMRVGEASMLHQDLPIMLGVTAVFIITLIIFKKIPRSVGLIFTLAYIGYMVLLTYQSLA